MTKGQSAPRTQAFGLRARAWWVMRETPRFTVTELLAIVANGDERDAASNLYGYLRALAAVGYLRQVAKNPSSRVGGAGDRVYCLARNTGPKAPVHRRAAREVYDPNTREVYVLAPGDGHGNG